MTIARLFRLHRGGVPQRLVDCLEDLGRELHNGGDYDHPKRREQIEAAAWNLMAAAADARLVSFDVLEGLEDLEEVAQ